MIPKKMDEYLQDHLPQAAIDSRLKRHDGMCFLEFDLTDKLLLARLGITVDKLGPRLVVCTWDEVCEELHLKTIMTREVVLASPDDSILDIVRELEQHQISAMPVVEDGRVLGLINSDLPAQSYLLQYLESRETL